MSRQHLGEHIVLKSGHEWKDVSTPIEPSVPSTAYGVVNQLRDPALLLEDNVVYMLYAVTGESGFLEVKTRNLK